MKIKPERRIVVSLLRKMRSNQEKLRVFREVHRPLTYRDIEANLDHKLTHERIRQIDLEEQEKKAQTSTN